MRSQNRNLWSAGDSPFFVDKSPSLQAEAKAARGPAACLRGSPLFLPLQKSQQFCRRYRLCHLCHIFCICSNDRIAVIPFFRLFCIQPERFFCLSCNCLHIVFTANALVQDTAFELYDITKKDIYRNALKRSRQSIVKRYFNEGKEEKLVKFFQLGFFAKSSLEKFLKLAHENNMNALAAYILTEIEKKAPKNASKKLQL